MNSQSNKTKTDGIVMAPFISRIDSVYINGEVTWYRNKWKNILLKIKHFFFKPKYLKLLPRYKDKPVNPNYYKTFKITKDG